AGFVGRALSARPAGHRRHRVGVDRGRFPRELERALDAFGGEERAPAVGGRRYDPAAHDAHPRGNHPALSRARFGALRNPTAAPSPSHSRPFTRDVARANAWSISGGTACAWMACSGAPIAKGPAMRTRPAARSARLRANTVRARPSAHAATVATHQSWRSASGADSAPGSSGG